MQNNFFVLNFVQSTYWQEFTNLLTKGSPLADTLPIWVPLHQCDRQMMSPAIGFAINGFFSFLFTEDAFLEL